MFIFLCIFIALAIISLLYLLLLFPGFKGHRNFENTSMLCPYAHRGLHSNEIPENSLAAFEKAVAAGFGIELDIQLSADGEVMVFHDYSLERMTGESGKLCEKTSAELRSAVLNESSEHIPTLKEVLDTVKGRVPLLIELKGESASSALCTAADAILSEYSGEYCIESFNPILVAWYAKHKPKIMRGQLYTNVCKAKKISLLNIALTLMLFNIAAKPDFIAYDIGNPRAFPLRLASGLFRIKKFIWTVKTPEDFETAKKYNSLPIFEGNIPHD